MRCLACVLIALAAGCGGDEGGGVPETLATGQARPQRVAVDATHVYWTNYDAGTIARVPLAGGSPEVVVTGETAALSIALDATHVYWATSSTPGAVRRAPLAGGAVETIAADQVTPGSIQLDGEDVYWVNQGAALDGAVMHMTIGGTPVPLAQGGTPIALALLPDELIASDYGGDRIVRVARTGGEAVLTTAATPLGIVADEADVYFATSASPGGTIMHVPTAGGAASIVVSDLSYPTQLVLDKTTVYATVGGTPSNFEDGKILAISRASQEVLVLADLQVRPLGIAQDATHLYWANGNGGTIMRVAK